MLTAASASVRLASPGDLRLLLLRPQRPVPADLRALDQAQPRTLRLGAGLQHHRQVATDTPPGYRYVVIHLDRYTSYLHCRDPTPHHLTIDIVIHLDRYTGYLQCRDPTTWLGDNRPRYDEASRSLRYTYAPGDTTVFFWSLPKLFKGDPQQHTCRESDGGS